MGRQGLLIGEVAARSGVSRKALRLYEAAGILPRVPRTPSGYRVYGEEILPVLAFVTRARRLGFSLAEIGEIVAIRRAGGLPCAHVRASVRRKVAELDQKLRELTALRAELGRLLGSPVARGSRALVCPHIEESGQPNRRRHNGQAQGFALPRV